MDIVDMTVLPPTFESKSKHRDALEQNNKPFYTEGLYSKPYMQPTENQVSPGARSAFVRILAPFAIIL